MYIRKNIAVSDSGFIFNPLNGDSYSVNQVGLQIIKFYREGKTPSEVLDLIEHEFRVDRATLEKDLYDFNIQLEHFKLGE